MARPRHALGLALFCAAALFGCKTDPAPEPQAEAQPTAAAPLPDSLTSACTAIVGAVQRMGATQAEQRPDSFPAFTGPEQLYGCVVRAGGPVTAEQPLPLVATSLPDSLGSSWRRDNAMDADGAAETAYGMWKGGVLCLVRVDWSSPDSTGAGPQQAGSTYSATIGCEVPRG